MRLGICDRCGQLIRSERIEVAPRLERLFGLRTCGMCGQPLPRRQEARR